MQVNRADQAIRDGLKGMAIGAATGAAIGALSGYLSTTKGGMRFGKWRANHSKGRAFVSSNRLALTYKESYDYDGLIDHKQPKNSLDCVEICLESMDEFQGGTFNPNSTSGIKSDADLNNVVKSKALKINYLSDQKYGHTNYEIGEMTKHNMGQGKNTIVLSQDHALNVKGYDYYPNWGKNGS